MLEVAISSWQAVSVAATLLSAFLVSLALVLTTRHHGHLTLDSTIGVQKFHAEPTPRVGGVAIYLGALVAWLLVRNEGVRDILGVILVAGFIPLACGLAEDLTKRVGVLPRLLATVSGGFAAWLISGVALNRLDIWGLDWMMTIAPVAVLFTAFAVGGVANAINIIDGFHGLASGTAIIVLLALGSIAGHAGDPPLALACWLVAAGIGGFWLVNYPWGKLFMGDGGAYFSGFAVAWLAVLLPMRNPQVSPLAALLVCAYPVIEVLYSMARRHAKRQSPSAADDAHLHSLVKTRLIGSKLSAMGVDSRARNAAVSPIMWGFGALPAIGATALFDRPIPLLLGIVFCFILYHFSYRYLAEKRVEQAADHVTGLAMREALHSREEHRRLRGLKRGTAGQNQQLPGATAASVPDSITGRWHVRRRRQTVKFVTFDTGENPKSR